MQKKPNINHINNAQQIFSTFALRQHVTWITWLSVTRYQSAVLFAEWSQTVREYGTYASLLLSFMI